MYIFIVVCGLIFRTVISPPKKSPFETDRFHTYTLDKGRVSVPTHFTRFQLASLLEDTLKTESVQSFLRREEANKINKYGNMTWLIKCYRQIFIEVHDVITGKFI